MVFIARGIKYKSRGVLQQLYRVLVIPESSGSCVIDVIQWDRLLTVNGYWRRGRKVELRPQTSSY